MSEPTQPLVASKGDLPKSAPTVPVAPQGLQIISQGTECCWSADPESPEDPLDPCFQVQCQVGHGDLRKDPKERSGIISGTPGTQHLFPVCVETSGPPLSCLWQVWDGILPLRASAELE